MLVLSAFFLVSCKAASDGLADSSPILSVGSRVGFAIAGKFTISAAFTVVCFYTMELLPTEVRWVYLNLSSPTPSNHYFLSSVMRSSLIARSSPSPLPSFLSLLLWEGRHFDTDCL